MVIIGHRLHTTLKTLLFKKNFRLSSATNKDYSSGEIINLIERDANSVLLFVWEMPVLLEVPFEFAAGGYIIYT